MACQALLFLTPILAPLAAKFRFVCFKNKKKNPRLNMFNKM